MYALITRRTALQGGLAFGAILAFGAGMRLDPPAPGAQILSPEELDLAAAVAVAMFPGAPFPVDGVGAGVPDEVDRLVAEFLVEPASSGFRLALRALEWGTLASRGARFSRLSADERREVLEVWNDPRILPRRVTGDVIKLIFGMAYFRNPEVRAAMGWRPFCAAGGA